MASCRIAWLMDPPRLPPLPPFRPSGGAFGPVAADVPAPHCAISDRVAAREGFYGLPCQAASTPWCFVAHQSRAGSPALREDDLFPGSETVFLREGGRAADDLPGVHR